MTNNRYFLWAGFIIPWLAIILFISNLDLSILYRIESPQLALPIIILVLANWFVQALQSRLLINVLGYPIRTGTTLKILMSSIFLNYLPLKPGLLFRGFILNRDHKVDWSDYYALSLFRSGVFFIFCGIIAYFGLSSWTINLSTIDVIIIVLLFITFLASLLHPKIYTRVKKFIRGLLLLTRSATAIPSLIFLITTQLALVMLRLQLCFILIGENVPYAALLVASASASALLLTPVTPGAIGVREFGVAGILAGIGIPFETGAAAMILDRLFLVLCAATCGGFSYRQLIKTKPL